MPLVPTHIEVQPGLVIPGREVRAERSRSSGPGGQHVNKTSSRVVLRWNPSASGALSEAQLARILERLATRLTKDGDLLVGSEEHREASRNASDAVARLAEIIRAALHRPKKRKKTKPSRGAKERRLQAKKQRGERKRERRGDY